MRTSLLAYFVAFMIGAAAASHADMKSEDNLMDGAALFGELSKEAATQKAHKMAETDFAKNLFRILVAGKRAQGTPYDTYLKDKYGVQMTSVGGCVVTEGIMGAMSGYNSTMKPLLNQKFGRDIFKEAEEASRK